jgi:mono/diheme cytochrome c family protein
MRSCLFFARVSIYLSLALPLAACGGGSLPEGDSAKGAAAVSAHMCSNCHQTDMSGTTDALPANLLMAPDVKAYASNLTPDKETGLGGWTDDQIDKAIREGINDEGEHLCKTMPIFKAIEDQEAADIIAYLRSLMPVKQQIPESSCER